MIEAIFFLNGFSHTQINKSNALLDAINKTDAYAIVVGEDLALTAQIIPRKWLNAFVHKPNFYLKLFPKSVNYNSTLTKLDSVLIHYGERIPLPTSNQLSIFDT